MKNEKKAPNEIEEKFAEVSVEKDTELISVSTAKLGDHHVRHEVWRWDGVKGETLIFLSEEVGDLDDEAIEKLVVQSPYYSHGGFTIVRKENFVFVNFNFED